MSDSESDIAFESADEGEELFHSPLKTVQHSNDIAVQKHDFHKENNAETGEIQKNGNESNCTKDTSVINKDVKIENQTDDYYCYRKTVDENSKQIKNLIDSNTPIVTDDSKELPKYAKDTCISEKQIEIIETVKHEDKIVKTECRQKFRKGHSEFADNFNNENDGEVAVKGQNESKKEKPERIVLKFEKKLSEKSKCKNTAEQPHKQRSTTQKEEKEQQSSLWGWGSWSSSLLSTAASSVSTFTSQVSEGFGTVLETVESTLGAPPPEELAAAIESKKKEVKDHEDTKVSDQSCESRMRIDLVESTVTTPVEELAEDVAELKMKKEIPLVADETNTIHNQENSSSLFDGVTSISKVIENAGSKVLMTGLDTLELIGKTTFDILTEGDPGLRKKRAYFTENTNLSQILREAKDKAETSGSINTSEVKAEEIIHYSTFFDNFQGIVHLEALEMLSKQSKTMLQGLLISQAGEDLTVSKETINKIQEACENLPPTDDTLDEESHHEFVKLMKDYTNKLELDLNTSKFNEVHENIHDWLKTCQKEQDKGETKDAVALHSEGLKSLAQLTACSMELFHKVGEMILYKSPGVIAAIKCSSLLTDITGVLCFEIGIIAAKFCHCLNTAADDSEDPDSIAPFITNVYLEASNSNTYIQDAFQLLVPILQVIALKELE